MDIEAILRQLRDQLTHVNDSIAAMERLAAGKHRGPGRPPRWLAAAKEIDPPKRQGRQPQSKKKSGGA